MSRKPDAQKLGRALTKRQRYELLRSQLDIERTSFVAHWKDLNDFIRPRRGRFQITDVNRGERRSQKIIDSTGTFAARTCTAGMMTGITNPAQPWFRLTTPNPELAQQAAAKDWLRAVTDVMQGVFLGSNWYTTLPMLYSDLSVFGTAAIGIFEDDENVIRCQSFPVGSYWLGLDAKLRVRVFMREFRMTVRQLVEQFGKLNAAGDVTNWENFSPMVRTAWIDDKLETHVDVVHVIAPNTDYNPRYLESKYKAFSSCYYERGASGQTGTDLDRFLLEEGFDECPIMAPRWEVTGDDTWATDCPGMTALGDIRELQTMRKRGAQALDKVVSPPMVADPNMRTSKLSVLPADVSYVRDPEGKAFRPAYQIDPRFDQLNLREQSLRDMIRQAFYVDLFLMLTESDRRQITAYEVAEKKKEKLLALGPLMGNVDKELLDVAVDRVYAICDRRGLLPPPPPELEGSSLKVEYLNILSQALRLAQRADSSTQLIGFVNSIAQVQMTQAPVLDKVDFDELVADFADAAGVSEKAIVPDEQVQATRDQRAQQAAQAQRMATLESGSKTAKNLAGSDLSGNNALSGLLSAVGGGGGAAGGAAGGGDNGTGQPGQPGQ